MRTKILSDNQWHQILKCNLDGVHTTILRYPSKAPPVAVVTVPYGMKNLYEEFLLEMGYDKKFQTIYANNDIEVEQGKYKDSFFYFTRPNRSEKIYIRDLFIVIHPEDITISINFIGGDNYWL